jgi:hypothetical protein
VECRCRRFRGCRIGLGVAYVTTHCCISVRHASRASRAAQYHSVELSVNGSSGLPRSKDMAERTMAGSNRRHTIVSKCWITVNFCAPLRPSRRCHCRCRCHCRVLAWPAPCPPAPGPYSAASSPRSTPPAPAPAELPGTPPSQRRRPSTSCSKMCPRRHGLRTCSAR